MQIESQCATCMGNVARGSMDEVMKFVREGRELGEAARAAFFGETGLKPMENPQRDKLFLDRLDLVSPFPSLELETAFYDSI